MEEKNVNRVKEESKKQGDISLKALEDYMKTMENADDGETEATETALKHRKIYVYRRKYQARNGKQYWEYILPVMFNGSVLEVHFTASDPSGYVALEKLFDDGEKKIEMQIAEVKQVDAIAGTSRVYNTYTVVRSDENGFEWKFPLKIRSSSDKAIMENYVRLLRKEAESTAK